MITGLAVADVDNASLSTTLSLPAGSGTLTVTGGSGATVTGDGSGTVTIAGTTAQINAALASDQPDGGGRRLRSPTTTRRRPTRAT